MLLFSPYLDVNLPDTGCAKFIPRLGAELEMFVDVLIFSLLLVVTVEATVVVFLTSASLYKLATACSVEVKSLNFVSYFCSIEILFLFSLFFSVSSFNTFCASSSLDIYAFSSPFSTIA